MTFQAYLDNIKAKTGKTPDDFHAAAKKKGLVAAGVTATEFTDWLKKDFGIGLGHARAVWEAFKQNGWVEAGAKKNVRRSK